VVKYDTQVTLNHALPWMDFYSYVLQNKEILRTLQSSAKHSFKNSTNKQKGEKKGVGVGIIILSRDK
jgi:hypothetical protein